MSALGSSVINKSGKKFTPKAPVGRPAAANSAQTSARASVDRHVLSQTPQPQSERQPLAASPPPSVPLPTPAPSQQTVAASPTAAPHDDAATFIAIPTTRKVQPKNPQSTPRKPSALTNSRKRTAEPLDTVVPAPIVGITNANDTQVVERPAVASAAVAVTQENPITPTSTPSEPTITNLIAFAGNATITARPSTEALQDNANPPAAKRRRVEKPPGKSPSAQLPAPHGSANVPRPTTETDAIASAVPSSTGQRPVFQQPTAQPTRTRKPRAPTKAKGKQRAEGPAASNTADSTQTVAGPADVETQAPKAKRPRKLAKGKGRQTAEEAAAEVVTDAVQGTANKRKGTRGRRRRSPTPEEAATETISPSTVKMAELCKDTRKGKKSKREAELRAMEEAEYAKKAQKEVRDLVAAGEAEAPSSNPQETADERLERLARANQADRAVPQLIIMDNEIIIDQNTLQIDRHANAAIERNAEQLESVDETDLSRRVNGATFLQIDRSGSWNEEQTDLLYNGLRMFGTDFQTISKMFPGRTRRSIKLKFCKEEKTDYTRIKEALTGERIPVDIEEFSKITNTVFDDPKELEREMEEDRRVLERDMAAEKEVMQEAVRKRAEEVRVEGEAVEVEESTKENEQGGKRKGKRGKGEKVERKKRGKRGKEADAGVEEVVLGPIEEGGSLGQVGVAA